MGRNAARTPGRRKTNCHGDERRLPRNTNGFVSMHKRWKRQERKKKRMLVIEGYQATGEDRHHNNGHYEAKEIGEKKKKAERHEGYLVGLRDRRKKGYISYIGDDPPKSEAWQEGYDSAFDLATAH